MNPTRPEPPTDGPAPTSWLGQGAIAALLRSGPLNDGLGPISTWPECLRTTLGTALASPLPMVVAWGPLSRLLYNDAFRALLGSRRHPAALGGPIAEFLPELCSSLGPAFERVRCGDSVALVTCYLPLASNGDLENRWFAVSTAAIRDEDGTVGGVLAVLMETTELIDAERRLSTLRDLALRTAEARTPEEACSSAATVLWLNPVDIPFGAVYLVDVDADEAVRACLIGLPRDHPSSPPAIALSGEAAVRTWPIARIIRTGQAEMLSDLPHQLDRLPGGPYPEAAAAAVLVPLRIPGIARPYGVLVAGVSPRRPLDQSYREFIDLTASALEGAICQARTIQRAHVAANVDRSNRAVASNPGESHAGSIATLAHVAFPGEVEGLRHDLDLAIENARTTRLAADATQRAKDEFLSLLGHELRDPLAPMTIVLRLMKQESGSEDMFPKEREILERQLARLSELVDDLRDVSRMTRGGIEVERRTVSLMAVLTRAVAMGAPYLERHRHQLDIAIAATGLDVDADETRLAQAMAGLMTSAVRHAEEGSRVVVKARREVDGIVLTIREVAGATLADVPAPGGSDGDQASVSARAPRTPRGIGVGFPILRNIIALHGGSVVSADEDSAGGFDVHLPLAGSNGGTPGADGETLAIPARTDA